MPKTFLGASLLRSGCNRVELQSKFKINPTFSAHFQMFTPLHSILFISFIPIIYTNIATSKYYSKCIFFLPYEPSRLYARSHLDTFPLFVSSNHILTYLNSSM